ncbi:MAG: TonB-linked SusC/RagA family outer membrane protein, partial [Salibacteraceae bacterium]
NNGKKGIGATFNSNYTFGVVDKSTFPTYQNKYGAGYGPYYSGGDKPGLSEYDFDGDGNDDYVVPFTEDASMGQAFDPSVNVFQWDALHPESDNYNTATPWVDAGDNGAISFFNVAQSFTNSLSLQGGNEKTSFRLSYRNLTQTGILPNSKLVRNNIAFNSSHKATDKLTISITGNYVNTNATGRNSTGYSDNIMSMYRQWWQTNVDVSGLKSIYDRTNENVTWNPQNDQQRGTNPIYWDNPYWSRYENYQNDVRDRIFGNAAATYDFSKNLTGLVRFTLDTYSELREERRAVGSIAANFGVPAAGVSSASSQGSGYARSDRRYTENNIDVILTYNKDINSDLNLNVMGGTNYRTNKSTSSSASTNGGLIVPNLYALTNAPGVTVAETEVSTAVSSVYGAATLGYKRFLYLDIAMRNDWSSTLSSDNRSYFYPAASASFVFSELMDSKAISFGKFRLNFAQVGKAAPFGVAGKTLYDIPPSFTSATTSAGSSKYNSTLKPERTTSYEAGLEMFFLNRKVGFDAAVYQTNSKDQIIAVPVSNATGYSYKWMNAGEIQNRGVELTLMWKVMKKKDFNWDMTVNWSKNVNEVISLADGIDNLQLGSYQGGISVNARVGETYGAITGSDYVYDNNGNKVVQENGYYEVSATNDNVIGNITPDFNGGMTNSFSYKNWGMSFLIDWQKGGDIFSLDQWYGQATGLYEETAEVKANGVNERAPIADGGGIVLDGVVKNLDGNGDWDGSYSSNSTAINGGNYLANGYARNPNKGFMYDASYVKLRELAIHYKIPKSVLTKTFIENATLSFVGSNLWIIHKNLPHADPESGLGSGNMQGFQSGVLPTTRNFGFNLLVNF